MPRVDRELGPDGKELTMPCDMPDLPPERRLVELEQRSLAMMDSTRITPSFDVTASEVCALVAAARDRDNLRDQWYVENEEVCQIAGKALGYPWFKDDQANFPGTTEKDGVCVGEHVPVTIVAELVGKCDRLAAELADAQHELAVAVKSHNICEVERTKHFERADKAEMELAEAKRELAGLKAKEAHRFACSELPGNPEDYP